MGCFSVSSQIRKATKPMAVTIGQHHDLGGVEPVGILAGVQHHLQRADPDDQKPQPHRVDRQLRVGVSRALSARQHRKVTISPTGTLIRKIQPQ